jgi:hypothetical protein
MAGSLNYFLGLPHFFIEGAAIAAPGLLLGPVC